MKNEMPHNSTEYLKIASKNHNEALADLFDDEDITKLKDEIAKQHKENISINISPPDISKSRNRSSSNEVLTLSRIPELTSKKKSTSTKTTPRNPENSSIQSFRLSAEVSEEAKSLIKSELKKREINPNRSPCSKSQEGSLSNSFSSIPQAALQISLDIVNETEEYIEENYSSKFDKNKINQKTDENTKLTTSQYSNAIYSTTSDSFAEQKKRKKEENKITILSLRSSQSFNQLTESSESNLQKTPAAKLNRKLNRRNSTSLFDGIPLKNSLSSSLKNIGTIFSSKELSENENIEENEELEKKEENASIEKINSLLSSNNFSSELINEINSSCDKYKDNYISAIKNIKENNFNNYLENCLLISNEMFFLIFNIYKKIPDNEKTGKLRSFGSSFERFYEKMSEIYAIKLHINAKNIDAEIFKGFTKIMIKKQLLFINFIKEEEDRLLKEAEKIINCDHNIYRFTDNINFNIHENVVSNLSDEKDNFGLITQITQCTVLNFFIKNILPKNFLSFDNEFKYKNNKHKEEYRKFLGKNCLAKENTENIIEIIKKEKEIEYQKSIKSLDEDERYKKISYFKEENISREGVEIININISNHSLLYQNAIIKMKSSETDETEQHFEIISKLSEKIFSVLHEVYKSIPGHEKTAAFFIGFFVKVSDNYMALLRENTSGIDSELNRISQTKIREYLITKEFLSDKIQNLTNLIKQKTESGEEGVGIYYLMSELSQYVIVNAIYGNLLPQRLHFDMKLGESEKIDSAKARNISDTIQTSAFVGENTEEGIERIKNNIIGELSKIEDRLEKENKSWIIWMFYRNSNEKINSIRSIKATILDMTQILVMKKYIITASQNDSIKEKRDIFSNCIPAFFKKNSKTKTQQELEETANGIIRMMHDRNETEPQYKPEFREIRTACYRALINDKEEGGKPPTTPRNTSSSQQNDEPNNPGPHL